MRTVLSHDAGRLHSVKNESLYRYFTGFPLPQIFAMSGVTSGDAEGNMQMMLVCKVPVREAEVEFVLENEF